MAKKKKKISKYPNGGGAYDGNSVGTTWDIPGLPPIYVPDFAGGIPGQVVRTGGNGISTTEPDGSTYQGPPLRDSSNTFMGSDVSSLGRFFGPNWFPAQGNLASNVGSRVNADLLLQRAQEVAALPASDEVDDPSGLGLKSNNQQKADMAGMLMIGLLSGQDNEAEYLQRQANDFDYTPTSGFYGSPYAKYGGSVGQMFSLNFPNHFDNMRNTLNSGNRPAVPIQAEKGEIIGSPSGDLVRVGARDSHKKMKNSDVTDITAEGNYIFSNTKAMQFQKGGSVGGIKLNDIVFDWTAPYYQEGKLSNKVREIKFMDLAPNKKKFTPAEFANNIRKKFPVTDRKDDAFAKSAIDKNKEARMPYIQTLQELSDMKNPDNFNIPQFAFGGIVPNISTVMNPIWNQPYDQAITGSMYPEDPMSRMLKKRDNAFLGKVYDDRLYTQSSNLGKNFFSFKRGGYIPSKYEGGEFIKNLGNIGAAASPFIPLITTGLTAIGGFFGNRKKQKRIDELRDYWFDTARPSVEGYLGDSRDFGMMTAALNRASLQYPTLDRELATGAERKMLADQSRRMQLLELDNAGRLYDNSMANAYSLGRMGGSYGQMLAPAYAAASIHNMNVGKANLAPQRAGVHGTHYNTLFGLAGDTATNRQRYGDVMANLINSANSKFHNELNMSQQNYLQGLTNLTYSDYNAKKDEIAMRNNAAHATAQNVISGSGALTQAAMPFIGNYEIPVTDTTNTDPTTGTSVGAVTFKDSTCPSGLRYVNGQCVS